MKPSTNHSRSPSVFSRPKVRQANIVLENRRQLEYWSDTKHRAEVCDETITELDRYTSLIDDVTSLELAEIIEFVYDRRLDAFREVCDLALITLMKDGMTEDRAKRLIEQIWDGLRI